MGPKIDFKGNPIFESAAWFCVIILKFIFTSIFEIKIHEKKFLTPKNFIFEGRFENSWLSGKFDISEINFNICT